MTPEQHAVYLATYVRALDLLIARAPLPADAVKDASLLAKAAADVYPQERTPEPSRPSDSSHKRGPGRPPKEKSE